MGYLQTIYSPMPAFYQLTIQEVLDQLKTTSAGLNNEAVPALQKEFGANALQKAKEKSKWAILCNSLRM